MKKILTILLFYSIFSNAQDIKTTDWVMHKYEEAFKNKDFVAMKSLISEDFTIGIFTRPSNDLMLNAILNNYYQLDSLIVSDYPEQSHTPDGDRKLSIEYFFEGQQPITSSIMLNSDHKIKYVDLFDNIYKIDRNSKSEKVATIPFKMYQGSIVLKAKLNDDTEDLYMLFDTGADGMALNQKCADKLNLQNVRDHVTNVVGGKVKVKFSSGNLLRLEGFDIPDQNLVVFPEIGHGLDGIIGGSFIRKYITSVNFDTQQIELYTFGEFDYKGKGEKINIEFGTVPKVPINAVFNNDKRIVENYVFDTGASYNLITFSSGVKKYDLTDGFEEEFSSPTFSGGTMSATRSGNVKNLELGPFNFKNFNGVAQDHLPNSYDNGAPMGSLGIKIIEKFNFTLDLLHRDLYLEPNKNYETPFELVVAGVFMNFDPSQENLIVKSIIQGSRAAVSKIKVGATVHSINGISAEDLLHPEKRSELYNNTHVEDIFVITQNEQSLRISI